ncbi:hypothetical protein RMB12_13865 [Acinetobacter sp. V117_2]|uniref:hypothetical protein n=1 Tax=Acinetobacter sp. V117_2 TaxID=3072989 RepID=UPI00287CA6E6|nr:hypothetical protein [Acinetobacter sp. V117_2]MDS7968108.1 hypothetical protein [Acinetobacter sp. V117_2]
MPTLKMTETYLSSSILIIPTEKFENIENIFSEYLNLPEFEDQTLAIDHPDENGKRKYLHLSFVGIEQIHDVTLYPHDESKDPLDLENALAKIVEIGTEFKLQYVQLVGSGLQYTSFHFESQGSLTQLSDDPLYIEKSIYRLLEVYRHPKLNIILFLKETKYLLFRLIKFFYYNS